MEILLISPDKIKIMLTADDMDKYGLNAQSMDYNMNKTREVIRELLKIAKERNGFEADGERIFIQAFPCKNGDCELYISKMNQISERTSDVKEYRHPTFVTVFDKLSDLVSLCNKIYMRCDIYEDYIYYDQYKNNYILQFKIGNEDNNVKDTRTENMLNAVVREFNGYVVSENTAFYLAEERYECLCGVNAIALFAKLQKTV